MTYGIWYQGAEGDDWCEHDGGIVYMAFESEEEAAAEAAVLHADRQRCLNSDIGRHWTDRDATFTARKLPAGQRFLTKRGDVAIVRRETLGEK